MSYKIKKLKQQDTKTITITVKHILQEKLKKYWTAKQIQAILWNLSAKIEYDEVVNILEGLVESSKDFPFETYSKHVFTNAYCCDGFLLSNEIEEQFMHVDSY